jgi:hypothetical protein
MNNIGEYQTVRGESVADLDKHVNEALAKGFQPHGDPYLTTSPTMICQAMVKEAQGKTDQIRVDH